MELRARLRLELVRDDSVVADERIVSLLIAIDRYGSILAASRASGLAYSRAWELISRVENVLGIRLVEAKRGGRGGGGARLTNAARELVARYIEAYRRLVGRDFEPMLQDASDINCCAVYAGSHDAALERLLGLLRQQGIVYEVHWLGSMRGVAAILLGEADIAGLHIPGKNDYNKSYLCSIAPPRTLVLIKGYKRRIGFLARNSMDVEEIIKGLLEGKLKLVNRPAGSGTRILLDQLLAREAAKKGISTAEIPRKVKGYNNIVKTHSDVAAVIARGEADVGLAVEWVAHGHGLSFTPVTWEEFDFTTLASKATTKTVKEFTKLLRSNEFTKVLRELKGYEKSSEMGSVYILECSSES